MQLGFCVPIKIVMLTSKVLITYLISLINKKMASITPINNYTGRFQILDQTGNDVICLNVQFEVK
jgi:hypothetical protein